MKKLQKKTVIIITLVALFLCILVSIFTIWKLNKYYLELNISEKTITIEYGVDELPEITALCKGTLINRKGTPIKTKMKGNLDLTKLGRYNFNNKSSRLLYSRKKYQQWKNL